MENSFGEYLRQQRETREISLEAISSRTKIQRKFLFALEKDQYEQLPGLIFVRGFIRAYAEQISLNPEQTLLRFEEYLKETRPVLSGPKSGPAPSKPRILAYLLIALFALVLAGLVASLIWSLSQNVSPEITRPAQAKPAPGQARVEKPKIPASLPIISTPFKLNLKATELCWLLATIDGKESKEAMLYAGDSFNIEAQEKLSLLIGNAGGVEISVNSVKLKPIGGHWKPMRLLLPEDLPKYLPEKIEKPLPETTKPQPGENKTQPDAPKPKTEDKKP